MSTMIARFGSGVWDRDWVFDTGHFCLPFSLFLFASLYLGLGLPFDHLFSFTQISSLSSFLTCLLFNTIANSIEQKLGFQERKG
ncbi:uncharacterized protein GGS22DRAFT_155613 [Annulohypoxylon maeteangense]|uniref:uncharacterized protein n=1 Tax=Annulohypoxylon maeteangense TaxID=1927788 RepID=UPI002007938C|nr:uncharacterized protein GGS22DRAFT_155613 [Annulohypoxylon maeteangense]KAI0888340.1 hypothetical protein GGS22DRAFT_155613 [Annulohypoxylon maeteangense]